MTLSFAHSTKFSSEGCRKNSVAFFVLAGKMCKLLRNSQYKKPPRLQKAKIKIFNTSPI